MDIIIILLLIGFCVFFFKRTFSSFIYIIVIIDIFLGILNFFKINLVNGEIYNFISKYFPTSIQAVINHYTSGAIEVFLTWVLVVIYIIFEFYIIRTFIRKK